MAYSIEEHQHRLSAWAAGRAFQRGVKGARVQVCNDVLKRCGIDCDFTILRLPEGQAEFDPWHKKLCKSLIDLARTEHRLELSHGQAAKLLNVYFKVRFVCGPDHAKPAVKVIHPPIDNILLAALKKEKIGGFDPGTGRYERVIWSRLDFTGYQYIIDLIKEVCLDNDDAPLWKIEQHWRGYQ